MKSLNNKIKLVAKLIIINLVLFGAPNLTSAKISHPYEIDQKPQILFGDSTEILVPNTDHTATTTYRGLENYIQDYKNGFAHFYFTYTHQACCTASYPPLIYITDVDPQSTSTPNEKLIAPAYALSQFWAGFGEPTDWYSYDIQFDASGYRVTVKQAGTNPIFDQRTEVTNLTHNDWVAIANRYPNLNEYSMAFVPVPINENLPPPKIDPVIIIPGIMGSAKKNGELVIDPILHTYDDLIATLDQNGYTPGVDLFTFPYEWRDSNVISANLLKNKINEVKQICSCSKVDLVAHSMGGLVAREYIQSDQYQNDVDQMIFLGTPHKGSPKAYLQWEAGEFPNGGIVDISNKIFFSAQALENGHIGIFDYIHNRPISSVQELLPIFDYLKDKDSGIVREYPNNYPRNVFLESLNSNSGIQKLLNSNVKITNIIGNTQQPFTIEKIRIASTSGNLWIDGKPDGFDGQTTDRGLERGLGDNTVTINGATIDPSIKNEEWPNSHNDLVRETSARIFNLLTKKIAEKVIILSPIEKILSIQLQSPIDVVITAPDGKKIGKNFANNSEYNEIPNAFYSGFNNGDDEYITIPNPLEGNYKIEVQGTDSGGKYGVLTSYISDTFATTTETTGITKPGQITELNLSVNNNNPNNLDTERKITLDVLINDINGAYDLGWIKDKKTRDSIIVQAKLIIKFEKKRNGKYEQKIDKILIKLLKIELDQLLKKNKITKEGYNLIKHDLEYLINNN